MTAPANPRDDERDRAQRRAAQLRAISRAAKLIDVELLLRDAAWR